MEKTSVVPTLPTGAFLMAELPLPPSVNGMYANVPGGRVSTAELQRFKQEALYRLNLAKGTDWQAINFLRENAQKRNYLPLKLEVAFYLKDLWKRDLDNCIKAVQDIIFQFLIMPKEDFLVVELDVTKRVATTHPHCKFRLSFTQLGGNKW